MSQKLRVAIIGGGGGGISAAYFLNGECDVDLFEARTKLGGHCDSVRIVCKGEHIEADLGAQFFHPATHPLYTTLMESIGLHNSKESQDGDILTASGSICIFKQNSDEPRANARLLFSSRHRWQTLWNTVQFAVFTKFARKAILKGISWEWTLEEWLHTIPVNQHICEELLLPWISALIGTTRENARRCSARSILQTFALAFPKDFLSAASTQNSRLGMEGNLKRLLDLSPGVRIHLNSAVRSLGYACGQWQVSTEHNTFGPYDAVVMSCPPHTSQNLLRPLAWTKSIVSLLERFEYFDTRIILHADPVYIYQDTKFRAVYNATIDKNGECEGSVWLGGIHGKSINIYKSWSSNRSTQPKGVLAERCFKLPLITPCAIRAARDIASHQGINGLYFSGQFTTGMDLQEATTFSAMMVAEAIAPNSKTLGLLHHLLRQRGNIGISYAL